MSAEPASPIVILYATVLFLGGVGCFIHFFFIQKGPIGFGQTSGKVPGWQLTVPDFLLGVFGLVLIALIASVLLDAITSGRLEARLGTLLTAGGIQLAALVGLFAFSRACPEKFSAPLNGNNIGWGQAFKIGLYSFFIIVPLLFPIAAAWRILIQYLGFPDQQQDPVIWLAEAETLPLLVTMVVLTVVVAPVVEELLFRGCLYRFLKAKLSMAVALGLSGLLFALLHYNLLSLVPLFILGVVLAYAYERTGSIKVPILIHAIFNANTIILIVLTVHLA
jgi:uncharacterized protein